MTQAYRLILARHGVARAKGHTMSEDALRFEWLAVDAIKQRTEAPLRRVADALFSAQEREVLERLPEALAPILAAKQLDVIGAVFDGARWLEMTRRLFAPIIEAVMGRGFDTGLLRIGARGRDFTSDLPGAGAALRATMARTQGINDTTRDALSAAIQEGLSEGETLSQIEERVRRYFADARRSRVQMIAQTASTSAFEAGQQSAFEEAGVERKRWLSQRDVRVRPSHRQADGQEVPIREPFEIGPYHMMHPGDARSGAPAAEIIRCRCTSLPVTPGAVRQVPALDVLVQEMNDRERSRVELAIRDFSIRRDHEHGATNLSALAERYAVSESTVRRAIWG